MQEVGQHPADPNQWTKGTGGWGQKKSLESDIDWNRGPCPASSDHTIVSGKSSQSASGEAENASEGGGASKSGNRSVNSSSVSSATQDKTLSSNTMASVSWGSSSSSAVGLDSSLWGGLSATSTNSTWGSSVTPDSLSSNQGHNTQIGASSVAESQNSNGSASAGGWGISPTGQNGSSLPGTVAQSQSGNLPGSSSILQTSSANQGLGSVGSGTMPWQNNKPFGMRDFTPVSDSSWNSLSTAVSSSSSTNKDGAGNKAGGMTEPGNLAAGLANLAIDKTAPPPNMSWNMKSGWSNSGGKLPVSAVGNPAVGNPAVSNPAELSFAQATQKRTKPVVNVFKEGVLSAKEEEIRRAINSNEGWGTRPIRQDTAWDIESVTSKASRKVSVETSEMAPSNVWNNNGTDIWEPSRVTPAPSWVGGAAGGGSVFADKNPNSWNVPPKANMDGGGWGGASNPVANNPMTDKTIGTWGGESQQQPTSKLWGSTTETGSWNEPPPERNMAWSGQDTDVGTWEDPALASANSRRIVSSSGIGPPNLGGGGNGMNLSNNSVGMGGANMPMTGSSMGMGSNNMGVGNSNVRMGGNLPMGGGNIGIAGSGVGMGGGNGMAGNMNMPMASGGGNMTMGNNVGMTNSNMGMGGANNMNMMMGGNNMNLGSNSGMGVGSGGDPSMYWNDPNSKPQGWNLGAGPPRPKAEEPWNKAGMGRPSGGGGWGEPVSNTQKADDGTSIWADTSQEQVRPGGWNDNAMWNPAFGARPKSTSWTSNGSDQDNWQRRLGQQRFTGNGGQPQMRIKLIQQLMDMGFKKEDAQNALISNNMNFESALGELTSGLHGKKGMENDVFQTGEVKLQRQGFMPDNSGMACDDMSENRADNNPHVPNFPMQNTPFNNAQVPNQPFMSSGINMYDRSKAGPQMPPNSGSNMNNLQHKLKVLQQQQGGTAPTFNNLSPTQVRGGTVPGTNTQSMVQQQAAQQQILQQLRMAVQSGLISPQLLNQQLPHNILVMLQQLLQLQNALQNLLQRQQFLQQHKVTLNIPRTQLEQVSGMITQYKSQIQTLQKQLQAAQQSLLIKQPPSAPTPSIQQMQPMMQQPPMAMTPSIPTSLQGEIGGDNLMPLPADIGIVNGSANGTTMSRLNQWKQTTPERDGHADLNKAPGSKPQGLQHTHSTPIMAPFGDLPSLNISGDTTWSTTAISGASNWPTASGDNSSQIGKNDGNTSGFASLLGESNNLGMSADVIPEFVPGQPWQGLNSKSVEDDPHITPGSVSRSLSVNVVKDDYLNNLTGNKSGPVFSTDSAWGMGKLGGNMESSMANVMSSTANLQNQQIANNGQWQANGIYSRQQSWAGRPGSAFTQVSGSGWDSHSRLPSSWLLKNVSSQEEEQ